MIKRILIFAFVLNQILVSGQVQTILSHHQIDSLQKLLPVDDFKENVDILNTLAAHYAPIDFDSSIMYSAQAVRIGSVYGYPLGIGVGRFNTGNAYYFKMDLKNALLSYLSALRIADEHHLTELSGSINIQLGNINFFVQRSDKAISYYRKAIANYKETRNEKAMNEVHIRMYMTMFFLGEYPLDSSIFYAKKTLEYARKTHDRLEEGHALMVIGMIYSADIDNPLRQSFCLAYNDTALNIVTSLNNIERISIINLNLGSFYWDLSYGNKDSSRYINLSKSHYLKGYEAAKKAGSNYLQVICLNGIAEHDILEGEFESVENHLQLLEARLQDFKNYSLNRILGLGNEFFERVFQFYLMRREKTRLYMTRFNLALAKGEYLKAIEYQNLSFQSAEEFRAEQEGRQLELLMAEAEDEKTDQKIRMLSQDNELNQLRLTRTRFIFAGGAAGVLIISLFLLLFFQRKRLKAEQNSHSLEQKLLRSQMNPHFIFNSLASIQNFVLNQKATEASIYLSRFSQLVRNILDSSVDESVPLQKEIETIRNYLELQKVRYAGQFEYSLIVDERIDEENMMIPPMLAQPFIENSIEHGIKYKETPGQIDIRFHLEGDLIRFEVEDDGVGREKAKEIEMKQKRIHRSMSTSITHERLIKLNKKLRHKIKMEIIDLKDNMGKACGTKVTFGIPLVVK
ncbi:MAG: histidine kinase [Bacteroidales bacterium]